MNRSLMHVGNEAGHRIGERWACYPGKEQWHNNDVRIAPFVRVVLTDLVHYRLPGYILG